MSRAVLATGAVIFALAAVGALGVTLVGVDRLLALLPPLAIDADAVGGAVTAMAAAFATGAVIHVAILLGLRARVRVAWTAAVLVAGLAVAAFVALAAAAFASAAARPSDALALVAGGVLALVVALAYAGAAIRFVREIRDGRPFEGVS